MDKNFLINCEKNEKIILDAFNSDSLHHAYLLVGNKGVGKFRFAMKMARFLMSGLEAPAVSVDLPNDDPIFSRIEKGGITDFKFVKVNDGKKEIVIEQIRDINDLFYTTSAMGGYRVVIIDEVELMNKNTANALLKNLEEPPLKTIFFLVCNNLNAILPTIRSRCFIMKFADLTPAQIKECIEMYSPDFNNEYMDEVLEYSDGSIGKALDYIDNFEVISQLNMVLDLVKAGKRDDVFNFIILVDQNDAYKIVYSVLLKKIRSESVYKKFVTEVNIVNVLNLDNQMLLLLLLEEVAKNAD